MKWFATLALFCSLVLPAQGESFSLFSPAHPASGKNGTLLSVTTLQDCLVTSFRAIDGEQRLDFFSINDNDAVLVHTRAFGNLLEDQNNLVPDAQLKAPRDLGVINGAVVWWSDFKAYSTALASNCIPQGIQSFDFKDSLNPVFNRGEISGQFASKRTVLSDSQIIDLITQGATSDEIAEKQYQTGLYDFTDPANPFLAGFGPQLGVLGNGSLERSILSVSGNTTIATLRNKDLLTLHSFAPRSKSSHLSSFFGSRVLQLFSSANLGTSLEDLKLQALAPSIRKKLLDDVILGYVFEAAEVDAERDLVRILEKLAQPNTKLMRALSRYGLTDRSTVQSAVSAIVAAKLKNVDLNVAKDRLQSEFAARVSELFYATPRLPLSSIRATMLTSMQTELTAQGLVNYLVNVVLAPLADDLPLLKVKFGDLLDGLSQNALGATVNTALASLDTALPDEVLRGIFLKGPACLNIPGSARQFIDLTLISSGPKLDPNGVALFELLKLADYYFENDDYNRLISELNTRISQLHSDIASELATEITKGINFQGDLAVSIDSLFKARLPIKLVLDVSLEEKISNAILQNLEASGIKRSTKLRPLLLRAARAKVRAKKVTTSRAARVTEQAILRKLTVGKFVKFVTPKTPGLNTKAILSEVMTPKLLSIDTLQDRLDEVVSDLFGPLPATATLDDAARFFLKSRINHNLIATFVHETLGEALASMATNGGGIPISVKKGWRAAHGDCLAQWQLAFDTAAAAATTAQVPAVAAQFVAAEQFLGTALDGSIKFVVQQTLSKFLSGVFTDAGGSYPRWHLGLEGKDHSFTASTLSGVTTRLADLVSYKDKVLLIQRNNGSSFPQPNADPGAVVTLFGLDGKKEVVSLGNWETLSIAGGEDGLIALHGNHATTPTILLDIRRGKVEQYDLTGSVPTNFARSERVHSLPNGRILLQSEAAGIHVMKHPST